MTIPLPVIPLTFRCALVWGGGSPPKVAVNVIHIRAQSGVAHNDDAFNALSGALQSNQWACVSNSNSINQVNIIALDGTSSTSVYTGMTGPKWAGGVAGEGTPQCCALVKLQTGLRGRNNRGRVYVPWLNEGVNSMGTLSGVDPPLMQTAWTNFLAALEATAPIGWNLVVASYDRAHGGAGAKATNVIAATLETFAATQRRRQPGRKVSRH